MVGSSATTVLCRVWINHQWDARKSKETWLTTHPIWTIWWFCSNSSTSANVPTFGRRHRCNPVVIVENRLVLRRQVRKSQFKKNRPVFCVISGRSFEKWPHQSRRWPFSRIFAKKCVLWSVDVLGFYDLPTDRIWCRAFGTIHFRDHIIMFRF